MYRVDVYLRVRRAVMVEGKSIREVSREFGLHRDTVRKMLAYSVPPGYRQTESAQEAQIGALHWCHRPDPRGRPGRLRKQRHTAKRIFERLRDEYGFDGGYTTVKDYVREHRRQTKEMFVPLSHPPGHAQCDFGEALVVIGGVERKAHCFVIDLPHSDGCFVKAYPSETTEAFLDSYVSALALVRGYVDAVVISCGTEVIASHPRSYECDDFVYDPIHYLPLLERKPGALDQAAPLQGWELPDEFGTLRRLLESRMGRRGKRKFVQVLRLLETFSQLAVQAAVKDAIHLGSLSFDAVKHLVLCWLEGRPPRLDLEFYPYLPRVQVSATSARDYMTLLAGRAA